jgi:hypothetical protein
MCGCPQWAQHRTIRCPKMVIPYFSIVYRTARCALTNVLTNRITKSANIKGSIDSRLMVAVRPPFDSFVLSPRNLYPITPSCPALRPSGGGLLKDPHPEPCSWQLSLIRSGDIRMKTFFYAKTKSLTKTVSLLRIRQSKQ